MALHVDSHNFKRLGIPVLNHREAPPLLLTLLYRTSFRFDRFWKVGRFLRRQFKTLSRRFSKPTDVQIASDHNRHFIRLKARSQIFPC